MFAGLSDRWKLVLQLFFVGMLCAGIAIFIVSLNGRNSSPGSQLVEFRVEASGGVAIITLDAGDAASISKPTTVSVPWTKSLRVASGTEVYLTASNPTQTGKVTCKISLNKTPWKSGTTEAPKDGVACAGIVP
jgi:predicted RecA/RadA family phage recombinase